MRAVGGIFLGALLGDACSFRATPYRGLTSTPSNRDREPAVEPIPGACRKTAGPLAQATSGSSKPGIAANNAQLLDIQARVGHASIVSLPVRGAGATEHAGTGYDAFRET